MISAGAVPKLVALLRQRSTTEEVRSNVVDALAHITAGDTAARKSIVSAGALPLLVSELDATPINETSSAAMALNNVMAALPDTRAQVLAAGPLPALISRLRSSNGEVQEETATVLRSLTLHCPQHQLQLLGAGALPPLIALLTRGSARAQEQAAGLLVILTSHPEGRVPAISAVQPLLQLIRLPSASVGLRQEAAQVLVNLAADVKTAAAMFDEGGVAILGDMLRQGEASDRCAVCWNCGCAEGRYSYASWG